LRIVHIPHAYHPVIGGAETICQRVSEILAAQGHDVRIVTTDVGAVQGYYEFGIGRIDCANEVIRGVSVTRLPFTRGFYAFGWVLATKLCPKWLRVRLVGRILEFLRRRLADMIRHQIAYLKPDVVMTMPHLVVNVQAVLTARQRMRFPLVMVPMLHEHDPNWDAAAMNAMKEALRWADAVITLTTHETGRLVEAYGVARERVFHASVGIDFEEQGPLLTERPKRIVFMGRKAKSKGIGDLIDAMQLVWNEMPDAELWIAGVRIPETAEIDRQIAALPDAWRHQVKDVGTIFEAEKSEFFRSARCLVLPSKSESFGMVILEAWAHATPVVAWDLPVFRSIVDHGKTGILADSTGGPRALAESILQILRDTETAMRMGEAGRRLATSIYSWQAVAQVYAKAYEFAVRHVRTT
jgi:glycogen(starch) synthase